MHWHVLCAKLQNYTWFWQAMLILKLEGLNDVSEVWNYKTTCDFSSNISKLYWGQWHVISTKLQNYTWFWQAMCKSKSGKEILTHQTYETIKLSLIFSNIYKYRFSVWRVICDKIQNYTWFYYNISNFFYAVTCHMYQTTKLHLILTSNVNFENGKALLTRQKCETTKLHVIFQRTYQNSIEANDAS